MKVLIILSAVGALSVASSQSSSSLASGLVGVNSRSNQQLATSVSVNTNSRRGNYNSYPISNQRQQSNVVGINEPSNTAYNFNSNRRKQILSSISNQQVQSNVVGVNEPSNIAVNVNSRRDNNSPSSLSNQRRQSSFAGVNDNDSSRRKTVNYINYPATNQQVPYNIGHPGVHDNVQISNHLLNSVRSQERFGIPCMCSPEYPPICGTDGQVYQGACQFNCGLTNNPKLRIIGTIPCSVNQ